MRPELWLKLSLISLTLTLSSWAQDGESRFDQAYDQRNEQLTREQIREEFVEKLNQRRQIEGEPSSQRNNNQPSLQELPPEQVSDAIERLVNGTRDRPSRGREPKADLERQKASRPSKIQVVTTPHALGETPSVAIDLFGDPIIPVNQKPSTFSQKESLLPSKPQEKQAESPSQKVKSYFTPSSPSNVPQASHKKKPSSKRSETKQLQKDKIKKTQASPAQRLEAPLLREKPIADWSHPSFSLDLAFSTGPGQSDQSAIAGPNQVFRYFSFQSEWIPEIEEGRFGAISVGGKFSLYPSSQKGQLGLNGIQDWAVGSQLLYQARFFENQPLVPVFGYHADFRDHQLTEETSTLVFQHGPCLGGWLLLNFIDTELSRSFYRNSKVLRTYLTVEWRNQVAKNDEVVWNESQWEFGLRFEL